MVHLPTKLGHFIGTCWWIYHAWSVWDIVIRDTPVDHQRLMGHVYVYCSLVPTQNWTWRYTIWIHRLPHVIDQLWTSLWTYSHWAHSISVPSLVPPIQNSFSYNCPRPVPGYELKDLSLTLILYSYPIQISLSSLVNFWTRFQKKSSNLKWFSYPFQNQAYDMNHDHFIIHRMNFGDHGHGLSPARNGHRGGVPLVTPGSRDPGLFQDGLIHLGTALHRLRDGFPSPGGSLRPRAPGVDQWTDMIVSTIYESYMNVSGIYIQWSMINHIVDCIVNT